MTPEQAFNGGKGLPSIEKVLNDGTGLTFCAVADCIKPATQACEHCEGTPDAKETYYCSELCRKEHRADHRKECINLNLRRAVYRAGDFVQWLFFTMRDTLWDINLEKLERTDDQLAMILSKKLPEGVDLSDILFMPFPAPDVVPRADREAVLSKLQSENAILSTFKWLQHLLAGFVANIEMYSVFVHKHRQLTIISAVSSNFEPDDPYHHLVLKVSLHMGEVFAIDMTGPQYGYTENVTPWERYCKEREIEVEDVYPFERIPALIVPDRSPLDKIWYDVTHTMGEVISQWERENYPLTMLVKATKPKYFLQLNEVQLMAYERLHVIFDGMHLPDGPLYLVDEFSIIKDRSSGFWLMRFETEEHGFYDWVLSSKHQTQLDTNYQDDDDDDDDGPVEDGSWDGPWESR